MNVRGLAKELDFEVGDLLELLDLFIDATLSDLDELAEAIEEGALGRIAQFSHSIKGAAISFGFEEIFEQARAMEANARRGMPEGSAESAKLIRDRLDTVIAAIMSYKECHPLG